MIDVHAVNKTKKNKESIQILTIGKKKMIDVLTVNKKNKKKKNKESTQILTIRKKKND